MIARYRAWDKKFKEMVQVDALVFEEQIIKATYKNGNVAKEDLKNYVLMQSTGLRDKNGKEIFEGDVLKVTNLSSWLEVVSFNEDKAMFVSKETKRKVEETPQNSMAKHIMEIKGCDKKEANRIKDSINRCYVERIVLTPLKVIQMEGLLSRDLFSKIAKYVLNNYEWPEKLDDEVDRITLEYRTKGELGRKKPSVKRALYTALAMGL